MKGLVGRLVAAAGPRNPSAAARVAAWITGACTAVSALVGVTAPGAGIPGWVNAVPPVVFGLVTVALVRNRGRSAAALCVGAPLLGVGLIATMDLLTHDASAGGQALFVLPVLYASSFLRRPGAAVAAAAATSGAALVSLALLAARRATEDVVYLDVALLLVAVVLTQARDAQDRLVARLLEMAAIDSLTGLVTRRVLDDATQTAISSAEAEEGTSLVLLDLDRFKDINDRFGHPVGDRALSHVASLLRAICRPHDVVARMGGDELAVLLPGCAFETALRRGEQIVGAVRSTPLAADDGTLVSLSLSAGVAHAPAHATTVAELYVIADRALYQAKRSGRGRVGRPPGETVAVLTSADA